MRKPSSLTVTDQFCGAGGSSSGAISAGAEVRVALNHWQLAIETYGHNHGDEVAIIEKTDVSACDPRRYPSTDILITSPECTTHSPAGGNRRRSKPQRDLFANPKDDPSTTRSRATMWDVCRFAEYHRYNAIIVENVVEAYSLWPLFPTWLQAMDVLGYDHEVVSLNSMFCHPTPQSRDRIYVVFWRKGNRPPDLGIKPWAPCVKCGDVGARQSFKNGRRVGKYRFQYVYTCPTCHAIVTPYYYAALNAIDFKIPGERIGDRAKPLRPRTMDRVRYGLEKYGRRCLVVNVKQGERDSSRAWPADASPLGSVPTWDDYFALAAPSPFLVKLRGTERSHIERSASGLDDAVPTLVASGMTAALVAPAFLCTAGSNPTDPSAIDGPAPTQTGTERFAIVTGAALMSLRDSDAMHVADLSDPTMCQTAQQQSALITRLPFLTQYYGQLQASSGVDGIPTVNTHDRHGLVMPSEPLTVDDCYFRMLQPHEIGAAMAFASTYHVVGTKRDKVKQYGNAVTPPAMAELFRRVAQSLEAEVSYDAA